MATKECRVDMLPAPVSVDAVGRGVGPDDGPDLADAGFEHNVRHDTRNRRSGRVISGSIQLPVRAITVHRAQQRSSCVRALGWNVCA